jgi:curved DNA-binding protein CbpA
MFFTNLKRSLIAKILIVLFIFSAGSGVGFLLSKKPLPKIPDSPKDPYIIFLDETFDTIKENYWNKLSDEQLANLYVLGTEKLVIQPESEKVKSKSDLEKYLAEVLKNIDSNDKKKEFATKLADTVLSNLEPFGRSRLYTQKEEKALTNNVNNVNPEVNRYQSLGVGKDATDQEIKDAYQKEAEKWNPETNKSPEAKDKFQKVQEAYKVLSNSNSRKVYDISGAEPTMDYKLIKPGIFYIHITKFSPTTLDELDRVTKKIEAMSGVDSLILDLRDNIGGAIDGLPYFLGPFIGPDQYAYQFFHQGDKSDFKTKTGWLPGLTRFKKNVILINNQTQSTAEVMAGTLKKYNVGVLVGSTSKGWGTVEKVFEVKNQLDPGEKYSILLVHSLTLREDGQPIEGKGIEPVINITKAGWEKELYAYFNSQELVNAVGELVNTK